MPAKWTNPRTRRAAMQIVMFAIFLAMVGLAAWLSRSRWRAQEVRLDAVGTVDGVRASLPRNWDVSQLSRGEGLHVEEPPRRDLQGRTIEVRVILPTQSGASDELITITRQRYGRFASAVEYLPDDPSSSHPSGFARVSYTRRDADGQVSLVHEYLACIMLGDRAALVILADEAKRLETDEALLRALARSVRLPGSEARGESRHEFASIQ